MDKTAWRIYYRICGFAANVKCFFGLHDMRGISENAKECCAWCRHERK